MNRKDSLKRSFKITILFFSFLSCLLGCKHVTDLEETTADAEEDEYFHSVNKIETTPDKDSLELILIQIDKLINNEKLDSTKLSMIQEVALALYGQNHFETFKKYSSRSYDLSLKMKDSGNMARSLRFIGFAHRRMKQPDSALMYFYEATDLYSKLKDDLNEGRMYISMANLREDSKDYVGASADAIEALKRFDEKQPERLSEAYHALAKASYGLKQYDEAIRYFESSIEQDLRLGNSFLEISKSKNAIAAALRDQGKYTDAIAIWESLMNKEEELKKDLYVYGYVLDNLAHTSLLAGVGQDIEESLLKALSIREEIKDYEGQVINHIHLSEYYTTVQDTLKARDHLKEAIAISYEAKDYGDVLKALKMLSDIEKGEASIKYANDYIRISDSLQLVERNFRNKFARIQFETDRVIKEKELLSRQKWWIIAVSTVLLISLILFYIVRLQQARNKQLRFEQQQQQSNEEIYNLMLSQQDKVQQGRKREQERISEELHDGVLSRLFGTRLNLDTLNEDTDSESVTKRKQFIEELKNIEQEIRRMSHDLSDRKIEESQFVDIVRELIDRNEGINGCSFQLNMDQEIDWEKFDNRSKIHIYRILQEAIQNINKYSKAKKAIIDFESDRKNVNLHISDDGVGFKKSKRQEGIGHKNIRSRVTKLKGKVSINSAPDDGTQIIVIFPSN